MKNLVTVLTLIATLGLASVGYADENTDAASNDSNAASQATQSISFADEEQNANDEPASLKDVVYSMVALDEEDAEADTDNGDATQLIDKDDVYSDDTLSNSNNLASQLVADNGTDASDDSNAPSSTHAGSNNI